MCYRYDEDKEYNNGDLIDVTGMRKMPGVITEVDNVNPHHYTKMAISPHEYNKKNNMPWNESQVIKYVSRWRDKNGLEDLKKALWYLTDLIEGIENEA